MEFNREKFKNLVLYIVSRAGDRPGFGATKLNKVLWFADARTYVLTGKPITGATYTRGEFGPIPRQIMPVRSDLEASGLLKTSRVPYFSKQITQFKALASADRSLFTTDEIKTVNYWIDHVSDDHTAASISDESHDYAWEIAAMGEEIPLYAFLVNRLRPSEGRELEWARAEAKRLGLT